MGNQNRELEFDVVRTLIIISALILHYNIKTDIGVFAAPSLLFEKYFFTMGGFFFFTSGYMGRRVYLQRFRENPAAVSKSLFLKGLGILALYLGFVFIMHILTSAKMPGNVSAFIYDHKFFTKALFTFGILIALTPIFLFTYDKSPWFLLAMAVGTAISILAYDSRLAIPESMKKLLFDRDLFLYPLLPSFFIFIAGFYIAELSVKFKPPEWIIAIIALALLTVHALLSRYVDAYASIAFNRNLYTFWEGITPFLFLVAFKQIVSRKSIKKIISSPYILCIGIYSLHFYFISNLLLGLSSITKKSGASTKLLGFAVIFALAYLFTYWAMRADHEH